MNVFDATSRASQLELLLHWEGRLNNARVRELFNISQVRSSEWIREFREKYPNWTQWDTKTRSFHATASFQAEWHRDQTGNANSLSSYLVLTGLPFFGPSDGTSIVWAAYPDLLAPNPVIFAGILAASRDRLAIEIEYRSMRQPQSHARLISPHSIVRAGRRWHARAYCHESQMFKDFALGRINTVKLIGQLAHSSEADDKEWNCYLKLKLIAHPDLSADQAALVQSEYFRGKKSFIHSCRRALVNYVIQDLRASTDHKAQCPPGYQIAVANVEEVRKWLYPA